MNNSPRPLFLLHQTLQLSLCIRAGSVLLASTKPRFVRRTARWWSVIHHSREFPLLQSPMEASFTPLQLMLGIARGDLRLMCGCSAMETHFMKFPKNSYCADIASRGSLERVLQSEDRWLWFLQHSTVLLWTCVAYHFAAEPLLLLDVSTSQ